MKFRSVSPSVTDIPQAVTAQALFDACGRWLLDSPRLGDNTNVKHCRALAQAAGPRRVVAAQSRLGQLMCRECGNARDRRIGQDLLRQAARAGDRRAQRNSVRSKTELSSSPDAWLTLLLL
jgi:hypothetical protein